MKLWPLVLLVPVVMASPARADLVAWIDSLPVDPGVFEQLGRFERDEGDWPDGTPERLVRTFRERVRADVERGVQRIASGGFEPYVKVNYLSTRDFAHGRGETNDDVGRDFEEGVIRTEQLAFFPGETTPPAEALAVFVDPEFRKQNSSRIEELVEEGNESCLRTKGVQALMDPTWVCNRVTYFRTDSVAAEHSQVIANRGDDDFQTIYFKESVKVLVNTEEGLALFYINYTRGAKLGSFKKKFGRGRIEDAQRDRAASLAERLRESRGNEQ
jgi:hypothetical protein